MEGGTGFFGSLIVSSTSNNSKTISTSTMAYLIKRQNVPKKFKGEYI